VKPRNCERQRIVKKKEEREKNKRITEVKEEARSRTKREEQKV
jgi:hypothetical protein